MWRFIASCRYLFLALLVLSLVVFVEYRRNHPAQLTEGEPTPRQPIVSGGQVQDKMTPRPQTLPLFEKFKTVRSGMTEAEVETILGPPASKTDVSDWSIWVWKDGSGNKCAVGVFGSGTIGWKRTQRVGEEWKGEK